MLDLAESIVVRRRQNRARSNRRSTAGVANLCHPLSTVRSLAMIELFRGHQGDHDLLSRRYGFQSCGLRNVFSVTVALVAICNLVGG
jgi:hypothetical protein